MVVGKRKRLIVHLLLVMLSVLLGFCCLAVLSYTFPLPQETWTKHSQRVFPLSMSLQMSMGGRRKVDWQLYGDGELEDIFPWNDLSDIHDQQHAFLDTVSRSFQRDLLSGIPLRCPVGGGSLEDNLLPKKYERFLKTLESYASYHNAMGKSSSSRRTLVWWCSSFELCGGLGDRIRGITYSLLLAMLSRRRLLIVWGANSGGAFLHPHMINWKDKTINNLLTKWVRNDVVGSDDFINPYIFTFRAILGESSKPDVDAPKDDLEYYIRIIGSNETNVILSTNLDPSSLLDKERNGNDPEWLVDGLQWHGLSHLSPSDLDDVMGIVFRFLFKLDNEVLNELSTAAEVLGLTHSPYVAVHVRTGFAGMQPYEELIHHPKLQQNDSYWEVALQCAVRAADELQGKNMTYIFLATDSKLVKQMALSKYGMRVRTLNNVLLHVDKLEKDPHTLSAEEQEGLMVVWVEFLLLAQGKMLVMGESGFPLAAGLLCGLHDRSRTVRKIDSCS